MVERSSSPADARLPVRRFGVCDGPPGDLCRRSRGEPISGRAEFPGARPGEDVPISKSGEQDAGDQLTIFRMPDRPASHADLVRLMPPYRFDPARPALP